MYREGERAHRYHGSVTCSCSSNRQQHSHFLRLIGQLWTCRFDVQLQHWCSHCCASATSSGCDLCPGWIVEPTHSATCDEPQWVSLCQWVVKRLQAARDPECVVNRCFCIYYSCVSSVGFFFSVFSLCQIPPGIAITLVQIDSLSNWCDWCKIIMTVRQMSLNDHRKIFLLQWCLLSCRKPATEQGQNRPIILHHYGDTKAKLKDSRRKAPRVTFVNGIPKIPQVKQQSPAPQKLHYTISDGLSVI